MVDNGHQPGLAARVRNLAATGLRALQSRGELLAVEWQIERARQAELLVMATVFVFLALMTTGLTTAIIILLCPESARFYVAGGFALLYLAGAVGAYLRLRKCLRDTAFVETLSQLKKDRECLESFN